MNSNTVKKWLSFGLAISLLTGNTTVLQAEEEPVETEDLYEVTEDTESETAAVETAAEENEIDPEAENVEVPEGSLKDASGMYEDVNDFDNKLHLENEDDFFAKIKAIFLAIISRILLLFK